jgi:hypothetical protein
MTTALTRSSWINAWSLREACTALGVDLRVPQSGRLLPLPALPEDVTVDWLFFTEEASLRQALERCQGDPGKPGPQFLPIRFPLELLDDKWAFAEFLAEDASGPQCLRQWPISRAADATFPLILKCRHSWAGTRKLPRGWVCEDSAALRQRHAKLAEQRLEESWFFLQEWVTGPSVRMLSVGGFFDVANPARNLALVTDRVASYGGEPSSSAALVTTPDIWGLAGQAARVLARLDFHGPYELEFLVTEDGCRVVELNPRFWMQHGLYTACGNGLVRRYLGLDGPTDRVAPLPSKMLWVDGIWLMRRILRVDPHILRLWRTWVFERGYRAVICPRPGYALWAALWRGATAMRRWLG